MTDYTIVLADDHSMFREGIKKMISEVPGLIVIGEAGDGHQLLRLLKRKVPDLIILDISMPGLRGIEAAIEINDDYPEVCVLFLSMHKNEELLSQALNAGARGYLIKEDTGRELLQAIHEIRKGRTFLSSSLTRCLSTDIIAVCRGSQKSPTDPLTPREHQVLQLIVEGHTDRQIAELLFISLRTVQRHRYNLRQKLNLKHTADLVKYAIAKGYINGDLVSGAY